MIFLFCYSPKDTYRRRQMQRTITRQMSFDLTKLLVSEDWFSDISPQTMRRLLNIVSITGKKFTVGSVCTAGQQRACLGVRFNRPLILRLSMWQGVSCEPIISFSTGTGWHHGSTWQKSGLTELHGSSCFWKRQTECLTRSLSKPSMKGKHRPSHVVLNYICHFIVPLESSST